MAIGLVAHASGADRNSVTTSPVINSSTANLLVIGNGWYPGIHSDPASVFDSNGNTWNGLTKQASAGIAARLLYALPGTIGTTHTATVSEADIYQGVSFSAWSGAAANPLSVQNGAVGASVSTLATGSVMPPEDNCLIVTVVAHEDNSGGAVSIDSGFETPIDVSAFVLNLNVGVAVSYKIQTTAAAVNPTWNVTNSVSAIATVIAVFKGPGGGAGGPSVVLMGQAVM